MPLVTILKGEKSFPVFITTFTVVNKETREKIKYDDYRLLCFSGVSPDYHATDSLDKFKNDGDYDALLTEAKEYDQGDAPDLSKINLSPTKYRGDDLLVEDELYAVVYNPTVGGTYDVMRKVSTEEIKDNIIRYGLPEDATDDVKEVAKQMEKEEVVAQEEEQHYHRGR